MAAFAMVLATLSITAMFLPGQWWLIAMTLAILAIGAGTHTYRSARPSGDRLLGAMAGLSAATVVVLATVKVGLTWVAIDRVISMLGT